jgi:hypothetical protein
MYPNARTRASAAQPSRASRSHACRRRSYFPHQNGHKGVGFAGVLGSGGSGRGRLLPGGRLLRDLESSRRLLPRGGRASRRLLHRGGGGSRQGVKQSGGAGSCQPSAVRMRSQSCPVNFEGWGSPAPYAHLLGGRGSGRRSLLPLGGRRLQDGRLARFGARLQQSGPGS